MFHAFDLITILYVIERSFVSFLNLKKLRIWSMLLFTGILGCMLCESTN